MSFDDLIILTENSDNFIRGLDSSKEEYDRKPKCPKCRQCLVYSGEQGVPGRGQVWDCAPCGKTFIKTGGSIIDPGDVE